MKLDINIPVINKVTVDDLIGLVKMYCNACFTMESEKKDYQVIKNHVLHGNLYSIKFGDFTVQSKHYVDMEQAVITHIKLNMSLEDTVEFLCKNYIDKYLSNIINGHKHHIEKELRSSMLIKMLSDNNNIVDKEEFKEFKSK